MVALWFGAFGVLLFWFLDLCVYKKEVIIFFKYRLWRVDPASLDVISENGSFTALLLDDYYSIVLTGASQEARFFRRNGEFWFPVTFPADSPLYLSPSNFLMSTVNKRFKPILEDLNTMKEL